MGLFHTIPGETPIEDVSGLKIKGITRRGELNIAEARNILKAALKYFLERPTERTASFDYYWALQLHREMFGDVWDWAGRIRTTVLNLGTVPGQIELHLDNLMKSIPLWKNESMILQSAMLHHKAVLIHPFENGNGRWSRMLANIWLARNGIAPTKWPEEIVGTVSPVREEYLAAVKAADDGDYDRLADLHRRYTPTGDR